MEHLIDIWCAFQSLKTGREKPHVQDLLVARVLDATSLDEWDESGQGVARRAAPGGSHRLRLWCCLWPERSSRVFRVQLLAPWVPRGGGWEQLSDCWFAAITMLP